MPGSHSAPPAKGRLELRGGSAVQVRPIERSDRQLLVTAFDQLSPDSRYRRFFSPINHLTDRQLDYLTDVDHRDHEALIALAEPTGELVAVARYVRTHAGVAEPAIVVIDSWQGRGLAGLLLEALTDRARAEGIEAFIAPVLADNRAAIKLFAGLPDATVHRNGNEVELTIPLGTQGGATVPLRRLLHAVATGSARPALTFWQRIATSSVPDAEPRNAVVIGVPRTGAIDRVAEVAADVATGIGAEVHVVAAQRFMLDDQAELADRMHDIEKRLRAHGLTVETHPRRGDLAASLIQEAVRSGASLIVVDGSEPHAATPLIGSTWDHVTHHAPCNVLIAR